MAFFFFNDTATTEIYTLSLHDALPIYALVRVPARDREAGGDVAARDGAVAPVDGGAVPGEVRERRGVGERRHLRSEEHTSELQSRQYLVCRLLLEKKKKPSCIILNICL